MREIGVHDDDEVSGRELEPVDVGRTETELAGSCVQFDVRGAVGLDQLLCDILGSVGGAVVYDEDFPVEFPREVVLDWRVISMCIAGATNCSVNMRCKSQTMIGRLRRSL
jgi:hypothetical protein